MNSSTTIAPFPILVNASDLYHISDDGQRTRCGRDCHRWSTGFGHPVRNGDHCPRCGNAAEFAAVNDLLDAREAECNAQREEANRQSVLRTRAQAVKRTQIARIIAAALAENGFELEVEKLPAGTNTYVFATTEYGEEVAFEVNVNERTAFANRVRAKQRAATS